MGRIKMITGVILTVLILILVAAFNSEQKKIVYNGASEPKEAITTLIKLVTDKNYKEADKLLTKRLQLVGTEGHWANFENMNITEIKEVDKKRLMDEYLKSKAAKLCNPIDVKIINVNTYYKDDSDKNINNTSSWYLVKIKETDGWLIDDWGTRYSSEE